MKNKVLLGAVVGNLLVGLVFWFEYFTDYSWSSKVIALMFPAFVTLLGFASLLIIGRMSSRKVRLPLAIHFCTSGILYVMMLLPALLPTWLLLDELDAQATSPNGKMVAEHYYRGLGAFGDDQSYVVIKFRSMPFVERTVYHRYGTRADISWRDNNTIVVNGETNPKVIDIDTVKPAIEWMGAFFTESCGVACLFFRVTLPVAFVVALISYRREIRSTLLSLRKKAPNH